MTTYGDARLAERLRPLLGSRHPVAAAAWVSPDATTVASIGTDLDGEYEIGSVSKGLTGLLYADALDRGEVTADTTLGEVLPLGSCPAAGVTLASLSTHRSGLPRLPGSAHPLRRTVSLWRHGTNPYGETLDELLAQAREVEVGRPRVHYSNLGFELLGHAVAAAADTTFAALVHDRLAAPLGLARLTVPATPLELGPRALEGTSRRGRPRAPWTGEAIGPAGGVRAAVGDLAALTQALLAGTAPGIAALTPVAPMGRQAEIGAGWVTLEIDERRVTWHNGATGGFRAWLGLDRSAGTGAVVLSATSASVDNPGFMLLAEHTAAVR